MTRADWIVAAFILCLLIFLLWLARPLTYFLAGMCVALLLLVSLGKWANRMQEAKRAKAWKDYTEIISQVGKP